MSLFYRTSFCLFSFALLCSCNGSEKAPVSEKSLEGRWELVRGFRNQRETKTLTGTYFLFSADGHLTTNLPIGAEEPFPFRIVKDTIEHLTSPPLQYIIESYTDSTLVLSFSLRGLPFELHFRRADSILLPH